MMHKFMQIKPLVLTYDKCDGISFKMDIRDPNSNNYDVYPVSITCQSNDKFKIPVNIRLDELKEIQEWADWVVKYLEGSTY